LGAHKPKEIGMKKISSVDDKLRFVLTILFLTILIAGCGLDPTEPIPDEDGSVEELRVLFIGNSYTFANDLPQIFAQMAEEAGYAVEVTMLAEGGWTLSKHAQSDRTIKIIREQSWDYVILQEQSVIPAKLEEREQSMVPAIRTLDTEIRETGAKTILFMTWGRQDGLPQEGFSDYHEMQAAITEGYQEIGKELNVAVAPVGEAWKISLDEGAQLALWTHDGSHPSMEGSFLAACVFYAVIFDVSPTGNLYFEGLEADIAQRLQSVAEKAVFQD
jgi:hypothetical protein